MLGKLIKYEFKASGRLIPLLYLIVVLLAISGAAMSAARMYIYVAISFVLLFLAGAAALIITYVIVFLRFYRGMFGSEGYLAMTLPVTPAQLYLSKTIVATCWLLLSGVVMTISWGSAFASLFGATFRELEIPAYALQGFYELVEEYFTPGVLAFILLGGAIGYLSFISQVYFSVTLSNVRPFQNLGIGAAIITFVVLQIVTSIINTGLSAAIPYAFYFDAYSGWSFGRNLWPSYGSYLDSGFSMSLGGYILPILFAFALPFLTIWLIDRKVNVK